MQSHYATLLTTDIDHFINSSAFSYDPADMCSSKKESLKPEMLDYLI